MIRAISLNKRFNGTWALKDLDLHVKKGEFYCLLGPNGAGKTTTLKLFTGLIKPTRGRILIGGFDIAEDSLSVKKLLGFIPDTPFIYENLTGIEFLEFVGTIFKIDQKILSQRIDYYLELFGLRSIKDALLRDYSHGMRQKIIYISNLIHEPCVLFVDEPLVGLDPLAIRLVKNI